VSEVEKHWRKGSIRVTNDNLKQFLLKELKETHIKSGFQVTSAGNELERIFDRKIRTKKDGNALALEWRPAS
jgi:hypothetical protein